MTKKKRILTDIFIVALFILIPLGLWGWRITGTVGMLIVAFVTMCIVAVGLFVFLWMKLRKQNKVVLTMLYIVLLGLFSWWGWYYLEILLNPYQQGA